MIGWTYECESWSSHMPSRCGKLDYSRCYPYPIEDVEEMVEDYAAAKKADKAFFQFEIRREHIHQPSDFGHHFRANSIAGQQQEGLFHVRTPLIFR